MAWHGAAVRCQLLRADACSKFMSILAWLPVCGNGGLAPYDVFRRAVTQVAAFLSANSIPNHVYHKNLPPKDQAAALEAMAHPAPEHNLVLVSTDAAARGIDLPQVTHVIQADFVANAIEFLHRVGRTARAGRSGKVTSLYTPAGKENISQC